MKIKEFEKLFGFKPKFDYYTLDYLFRDGNLFIKKENTKLLNLIKKLANLAYPDEGDPKIPENKWYNFYLPIRMGKVEAIRVAIVNYKNMYSLIPTNFTPLEVYPGNERIEEEYFDIVKEMIRFSKVLKKNPEIIKRCLSPEMRTGKILGKYIMEKVLSKKEKERITNDYFSYMQNMKFLYPISLKDYLEICAICYKAAFGNKTKDMNLEDMYKRWADGRDCGMLKIKKKESKKAFIYWLHHKSHCGGHPFEIVFSWHEHGIHLYPPSKDNPWFKIYVTNYAYAWDFLKMVMALIKNKISFKAPELEKVLKFLAGETYFRVNEYDEHFVFYHSCKDKRKFIEWDKIELPKFKP
ncbi:hypothetical protein DRN69_00435 [Candidatus Pacearchaeota archaeon]|nr:MAG: hypothetical protein DRN69_00435 [Candidatus Pacearchaeota archaeon]